jgi:hypothetical protein
MSLTMGRVANRARRSHRREPPPRGAPCRRVEAITPLLVACGPSHCHRFLSSTISIAAVSRAPPARAASSPARPSSVADCPDHEPLSPEQHRCPRWSSIHHRSRPSPSRAVPPSRARAPLPEASRAAPPARLEHLRPRRNSSHRRRRAPISASPSQR